MNSIKAEISETRWEEEKREMKKAHEDAMAEKDAEIDRLRRMNDQGKKIEVRLRLMEIMKQVWTILCFWKS